MRKFSRNTRVLLTLLVWVLILPIVVFVLYRWPGVNLVSDFLAFANQPAITALLSLFVVVGAAVTRWIWRGGRNDKQRQATLGVDTSIDVSTRRELTQDDMARLGEMTLQMRALHGFTDLAGLMDDLYAGKPLSGRCSVCGGHRFTRCRKPSLHLGTTNDGERGVQRRIAEEYRELFGPDADVTERFPWMSDEKPEKRSMDDLQSQVR